MIQIWRTSILTKLAAIGWIGGIGAAISIDLVVTDDDWIGAVLVALGAAIFIWRVYYYPALVLNLDSVVVINPLSKHQIALGDISSAKAGWSGLELSARDQQVTRAWAVQKSRLSGMLGRTSRADIVARNIEKHAGRST